MPVSARHCSPATEPFSPPGIPAPTAAQYPLASYFPCVMPPAIKESKKADNTCVSRDEVASILRGTTHIDPEQRSLIHAFAHSPRGPVIHLVCLLTVASGAVYLLSTASSGANFSRLFREKACSRWPFLSVASRSAYFSPSLLLRCSSFIYA